MNRPSFQNVGVVIIGRNEGERLARCLISVRSVVSRIYVDSGSTDSSVVRARTEGADVIELPVPPLFTAARARNAGLLRLIELRPEIEFVQMVDGDCEVQPSWIAAALQALHDSPRLAAVFGRRRERYPAASVYNAICDDEWNVPLGIVKGCGGDALFRIRALQDVGLYNGSMIAAEDTELSIRLREKGWLIERIGAEMTLHDAAISRFSQWWNRIRRSGHGYAEIAHLHAEARDPDWRKSRRSILIWGAIAPVTWIIFAALALHFGMLWSLPAALILLIWIVKAVQLRLRAAKRGLSARVAWALALLTMTGKVPQLQGLVGFYIDRIRGRASHLIEYK